MASSTRIGSRLNLTVGFLGAPVPRRTFYHNGNEVDLDGSRVSIDMGVYYTSLTIDNAQLDDEGLYTCIAVDENSIMSSSTYVTLFCEESEIVKQAPEFVRTLESMKVEEHEHSLDLTCQVQSFTPFDIQWKRNTKSIPFDTDKFR